MRPRAFRFQASFTPFSRALRESDVGRRLKTPHTALLPSGRRGKGPFCAFAFGGPRRQPVCCEARRRFFMPAPSRRGVMASEPEPAFWSRPFMSLRPPLEAGVGLKSSPCRHLWRMGFRAAVGGFVDRSARKRALAKGRPSRDREEGMRAFPSTRGALSGTRASLLTVRRACLGHEGGNQARFFFHRGLLATPSVLLGRAGFSGAGGFSGRAGFFLIRAFSLP